MVFVTAFVLGGFAAIFPERTVELRRYLRFSDNILSEVWFYTTPKRARITGTLSVLIGGIAVAFRLLAS
jgi:hypothetical protein